VLHMEHKIYKGKTKEGKNIKLEIVSGLLGNGNHVRGIAKSLGINHMTVARKINELMHENVIDFKEEGKNKKVFLKKTIEAKNYAFMAEQYKLNNLINIHPNLRKIVEKVQGDRKIKLAVLFGSYAKGIARDESDIDLYIETEDREIKLDLERVDSKLSVKIGKYNKESILIKEIEKNHIIIKGVESFYEKSGIFE